MGVALLAGSLTACGGNDDKPVVKDTTMPTITAEGITASPLNCDQYKRGQTIYFRYVLKDNVELGNYMINIHHNFDHHTHSTEKETCALDPEVKKGTAEYKAKEKNAWNLNLERTVPAGQKMFLVKEDIPIPATIEPGDYHCVIYFLDAAGNQEHKSFSIKIVK